MALGRHSINGHHPGQPPCKSVPEECHHFGFYWSKDDGGGGDNWSYKTCKAPVKSSPPTNQHPVFTGQMPFLSPNQQRQSTDLLNPAHHGWGVGGSSNVIFYN